MSSSLTGTPRVVRTRRRGRPVHSTDCPDHRMDHPMHDAGVHVWQPPDLVCDQLGQSDADGSKWDMMISVSGEFDVAKDSEAKHHGMLVKQVQFIIEQNEKLKGFKAGGIAVPSFLKV